MKIKEEIKREPNFYNVTLSELIRLMNVNGKAFDTNFYVRNGNTNKYIYSIENNFYVVEGNDKNRINSIIREQIKKISNLVDVPEKIITIEDMVALFKYNSDVRVDNRFLTYCAHEITYEEFLRTVKEVISIEDKIRERNIDYKDKFKIMKFIYDKYKLECSYWSPIDYYGTMNWQKLTLRKDYISVAKHPFDPVGLVVYKYATCEGMAVGLKELFNYFGIKAEKVNNDKHAITKVYLEDANRNEHVSYIDLSNEVTYNFKDNKYEYINGKPYLRRVQNRRANESSYTYFMKKDVGRSIKDSDFYKAIDYNENSFREQNDYSDDVIRPRSNYEYKSADVMRPRYYYGPDGKRYYITQDEQITAAYRPDYSKSCYQRIKRR